MRTHHLWCVHTSLCPSTSMSSWSQITSLLYTLLLFMSSCSPSQKGPLTTQLARPPKQQRRVQRFSGTVSAGLRASTAFRKQERSRACVIGGDKRWRERARAVWKHIGGERNLIYYHPQKNQLQMFARRFSPCPQLWRLTQRSAQPPSFLPYAHIYKHAD